MNIAGMHTLFRVLGQQMGIQEVRAILPKSIDCFLNQIIVEKVRTLIMENLNVDLDNRQVIHRENITPINALRTLYSEKEVSSTISAEGITEISIDDATLNNMMLFLGVSAKFNDEYKRFGCRIADAIDVENTLNDYCNSASKDYPIANFYGNKLTLFTGKFTPSSLNARIKYIKYPATVLLSENEEIPSVDCDLPPYLHNEIVESAVRLFFTSVGYTSPNKDDSNTK